MSRRTTTFSTLVLAVLFVALPGFLVYSRWMRTRLLPSALRYMPPEANVLIGVGDIASVWDGMEHHFGSAFREKGRQGGLAESFAKLGEKLGVKKKEDLVCRYGIDVDRGILAGLSLEDFQSAAVIPVADGKVVDHDCKDAAPEARGAHEQNPCPGLPEGKTPEEKLVRFFCSLLHSEDQPPEDQPPPSLLKDQIKAGNYPCDPAVLRGKGQTGGSWSLSDHAYDLHASGLRLVFPRPDTAFLSSSCEFLDRGLAEQERNLSYARGDDALFEAVRSQLRRPLLSGPGALVYLRGLAVGPAAVGPAAAAINLEPDALVGDLRLRTAGINARIVADVLAAPDEERPWREFFSADDAAVLVLRDDSLPRYIDFAAKNPDLDAKLRQLRIGEVIESARRLDRLEQIVLGGIDYREGLPVLVLGLWGSRAELNRLVLRTQQRLRQPRDEALLQGAMRDHPPQEGEGSVSLDEMIRASGLADDPAWFKRFRLEGGRLQSNPLTQADFSGPGYLEAHGGYQIRYLEPPVTAADLKYRFPADANKNGILLENRYRLASTIMGDILWISTGEKPLLRMIDRLSGARPPRGFLLGTESDHGNKLRVLVNTSALIEKGLLSGESSLLGIPNQLLLDFRDHRKITISLKPARNGQELRMELVAYGPAGGARPRDAASKKDGGAR